MTRRLASAVACACAALALAISPGIAAGAPWSAHVSATTTPAVPMTLKAPIAVRKSTAFVVRGGAGSLASPGETVTIQLLRKSAVWSVVSTGAVSLAANRTFTAKLSATKSGHWRVTASLPASAAHASSSISANLKVVGSKVIALTFDDGPWPSSTASIVSALRAGDAQATFFMLGAQVGPRKKLAQLVVDNGNLVGVHSWNHAVMVRRSASVNSSDLARCKKAVLAATGVTPHWFRPPYGSTNATLKATASNLGLRQVIWSVDTLDWKYRNTPSVVSRTMSSARDGSIVLMHDGGGPRAATAAAVPIVINRLRANGFDFVTLDEMVALGYPVR